jgi:DNA-binding NarL/FixJ family response regulator
LAERETLQTAVCHPARQGITVFLVDDHAMVRQGLRAVFEGYEDFTVIGEASNGKEAIEGVEKLHPQIVLMDVNMPKMNGIEATAMIKAHYPWIIVIGVSVNPDPDKETAMLKAGAATLIHKESAVESLYEAMKEVVKNEPRT